MRTNYAPPAVGSKLDYVRGILTAYAATGYRITPLYPGDIKVSAYTPSLTVTGISPARRTAAFPLPTDPVQIRIVAKSINPDTSVKVDSAVVYYSVNNGSFVRIKMTREASDTTFIATIPPQGDGSLVKYFFSAWQDTSAYKSTAPDTSKAYLFYYVRSHPITIRDVQYTPFRDGASGAVDLPVTIAGVIQADTSDFPAEIDHRNQSTKTPVVYMQAGNAPWSGIVLFDTVAYAAHRGDSVLVSGSVTEYSGMTEIIVDSIKVVQSGRPSYQQVVVTTGAIGGKACGDSTAEKWEGMLIKFDTVTVTDNDPDPTYSITSQNGSFREYTVNDGSGNCRVDDDGSNMFSPDPHDTAYGFTIIRKNSQIESLAGILRYANGNYKLEPRTNADFGTITGIRREPTKVPGAFALEQNYPNPFNPSTTIRYSVPKAGVVSLKIYNVLGQEVATLVNHQLLAGSYSVTFDAGRFASGVYFYRLSSGDFSSVKKMLLLK